MYKIGIEINDKLKQLGDNFQKGVNNGVKIVAEKFITKLTQTERYKNRTGNLRRNVSIIGRTGKSATVHIRMPYAGYVNNGTYTKGKGKPKGITPRKYVEESIEKLTPEIEEIMTDEILRATI